MSAYNYVQNNPLLRIDPTGALDTIPSPPEISHKSESTVLNKISQGISDASWHLARGLESIGVFPEQGSADASDFHDGGSTIESQGKEVMTGDNRLSSAGTMDQATSEEGSDAIIDEMFSARFGNAGGMARKVEVVGRAHDGLVSANRVKAAVIEAKEQGTFNSSDEVQVDTVDMRLHSNGTTRTYKLVPRSQKRQKEKKKD